MQVRAQSQTQIPPKQSTTCNFLFRLSSFFVSITLTSPQLRSGLRCSRIEMTHCSLGTDKDMETQENETNQDTTPPTNGTPIQLLFFLLLFLFLSCRDPHQQPKNKYAFTAGCARFH